MVRVLCVLLMTAGMFLPTHAVAFVDAPSISPPSPSSNAPITVHVRAGVCHVFFDNTNDAELVSAGNGQLSLIVDGVASLEPGNPFCIYPVLNYRFAIGALPAGSYTLQLLVRDPNFPETPVAFGTVSFSVSASPSIVHTLSEGAIVMTILLMLCIAMLAKSRGSALFALGVAAIFASAAPIGEAMAQDEKVLHVMLVADSEAPTPADIVEGYDFSSGAPPPLIGMNAESPQGAEYLLTRRAQGTFAEYLDAFPDTTRAQLERYIILHYSPGSSLTKARNALAADPNVEYVHIPDPVEFSMPPAMVKRLLGPVAFAQVSTDWSSPLAIPSAWTLAGGWSLVGVVDNGLATSHPDLVSFSGGAFVGGNYLPSLAADVGRTGSAGCLSAANCIEFNVDEAEPIAVAVNSDCDPDGDGFAIPTFAGHGTHVAGLVAANTTNTDSTRGACRHCGLAPWRVARDVCVAVEGKLFPVLSGSAIDAAVTFQADLGMQVINQSFNRPSITSPTYCQTSPKTSECLALAHATERGVILVAASGNNRGSVGFAASQPTVVATGGLGLNLTLWNRDPDPPTNDFDQCPQPPLVQVLGQECGSNFTVNVGVDRHQEIVAPAENVHSTTYPNKDWSTLGCGDSFGGPNGDGQGSCTGTSMASPIAAGIAGLLRSINPLVLPGDPENPVDAVGVRDVMVETTRDAQLGQGWDPQLGYGIPDAKEAAKRMLGEVRGLTARNRAIPLFDFYNAAATDYATTASPQAAMSLAIAQPTAWTPRGPTLTGYASYPVPANGTMPVPQASAYVLATEFRTQAAQPPLTPLYLLSRSRPWPLGCTPGTLGCNFANRDFMLVSTTAALQTAVGDGYTLQGRQGYIFQRCTPEPACMPAGSSRLYRQCNLAEDDCAIFLEHELATFQGLGYLTAYPVGSDPVMGYAYQNIDNDGDTLIDGFEQLIGTNPGNPNSDGDGFSDGVEYPLAGVPVSDPCDGPTITCTVMGVFADGFEP